MKVQKATKQWEACYEVQSCISQIIGLEENEENDEEEKKQYNSYISCYTCRLNKGQHMAKILLLL